MITRLAEKRAAKLLKQFRLLTIMGPRQSGKTTLAKKLFAHKPYVSLENPSIRIAAQADPQGFLSQYKNGAIIDEVQKLPELLNYMQGVADSSTKRGQFILTGSNNLLLMQQVTQSLAGRTAYLDLLPFSLTEMQEVKQKITLAELVLQGQYPEPSVKKIDRDDWYAAYLRTYIERDVRQIKNVTDLLLFQKFIQLCAGRIGQQLNLSQLGNECGVDYKTIQSWIGILQTSYIVFLVPPYFKNFNKRVTKTPKLYFYDTGLAAYLLGHNKPTQWFAHPHKGPLFENFIITELLKNRHNKGLPDKIYYYRDSNGHEADVVIDFGNRVQAIEIKAAETFTPDFIKGIKNLEGLTATKDNKVIYAGAENFTFKGVEILNWKEITGE
jgi:predicted AAA+ superfamily ATPase